MSANAEAPGLASANSYAPERDDVTALQAKCPISCLVRGRFGGEEWRCLKTDRAKALAWKSSMMLPCFVFANDGLGQSAMTNGQLKRLAAKTPFARLAGLASV